MQHNDNRHKQAAGQQNESGRPGLRLKLFIADETVGVGKIELLEAVDRTGSISAAADAMGMDYRRAWFLLKSTQQGFKVPLFTTRRGGTGRGGASLTPEGRELIRRYWEMKTAIDRQAEPLLQWLEVHQAEDKALLADKDTSSN